VHEVKWDGYRAQAHLAGGKATIFTRNGYDWTRQFAPIAAAVAKLNARSVILDGEAVTLDQDGRSDFGALRDELDGRSLRLRFYAFDLLELNGVDLRPLPLLERRKRLSKLLWGAPGTLIEVEALEADGAALVEAARKLGLEGIVSKKASRPTAAAAKRRG
jgi:bifunctional non-homologous end joining protein LigD